jgi:hypothetical protein
MSAISSAGEYRVDMVDASKSRTPALDEWTADVGEDGVAAAVASLKAAVADQTVPLLRDETSLRTYWDGRRQRA